MTDPRTPEFASYATLRRGIAYERELAEWCGWLAAELERAPETDDRRARAPPRRGVTLCESGVTLCDVRMTVWAVV